MGRMLELSFLNRFRHLRNEKVSVRTICERDGVFSTCPSTLLIVLGQVLLGRGVNRSFINEQIVLKIACGCL